MTLGESIASPGDSIASLHPHPAAIVVAFVALFVASILHSWLSDRRRDRRRALFSASGGGQLLRRIRRSVRSTLLLVPAREPGFSKLGGLPELPEDLAWPDGDCGPRAFVAQVDLAHFQSHAPMDWLPEAGRIYAFFDEERNGAADCVKVLYSRSPPAASTEFTAAQTARGRYGERRVGFLPLRSTPSPAWLGVDPSSLSATAENEELAGVYQPDWGDEIEHRLGGYPSELQDGQMQVECEYLHRGRTRRHDEPAPDNIRNAARQWRLLLQVDSDPALGMNWWDSGRLYVFIRKRDARRGDFSRTVTITQSH